MSKKENTREQKLKYIFAQNPKDNEFHVTSDDQAFRVKSDALNHAKTLEDKSVKLEKRENYVKPAPAKESKPVVDEAKKERESLFARHEELFGQKPAANAPTEKLKAKIEAEESRLAEVAQKDAAEAEKSGEEE